MDDDSGEEMIPLLRTSCGHIIGIMMLLGSWAGAANQTNPEKLILG